MQWYAFQMPQLALPSPTHCTRVNSRWKSIHETLPESEFCHVIIESWANRSKKGYFYKREKVIIMIASKQIICKSGSQVHLIFQIMKGFSQMMKALSMTTQHLGRWLMRKVFVYWDITLCSVASSYLELSPGIIYITQIISVRTILFKRWWSNSYIDLLPLEWGLLIII